MGILGLTHESDGQALQRLPVVVKVAIGRPPDVKKGRKAPEKTDHFLFQTRSGSTDSGWDEDAELTTKMEELYGQNAREIEIAFLDDEIDNVFRTQLAWWSASECKCSGKLVQIGTNGSTKFIMQAIRRTEKHPEGEPWPGPYKYQNGDKKGEPAEPCGDTCPDLEEGRCKPSADLYFVPFRIPALGMTWKLHTTSYNSIRNINSALQQIRLMTGGRLAGIPLRLRVDPQRIAYRDGDDKAHKTTAHILSIVFRGEDMQRLISGASEYARLFEQSRKALGPARIEIVEDGEPELARSVGPEFHAEEEREEKSSTLPKANIPPPDVDPLEPRVIELCKELGINTAKMHMMMGQFAGKYADLVAKLESDLKSNRPAEGADAQRKESQPTKSPTQASQPPQSTSKVSASFDF